MVKDECESVHSHDGNAYYDDSNFVHSILMYSIVAGVYAYLNYFLFNANVELLLCSFAINFVLLLSLQIQRYSDGVVAVHDGFSRDSVRIYCVSCDDSYSGVLFQSYNSNFLGESRGHAAVNSG